MAGLVELAVDRFQGLDCIFNNAGVGGAFGPIGESTAEEWDFTFAVLVRGVFLGGTGLPGSVRDIRSP